MDLVGTSSTRASDSTAADINARIARDTQMRLRGYAAEGDAAITARLAELDREWDVERCLQTGASFFTVFGTTLGATVSRKWFLLPATVMGFFLQHGVQGWCPPLIVFRKLGVRTMQEIDEERYALKVLRGDFADVAVRDDAVAKTLETVGRAEERQ